MGGGGSDEGFCCLLTDRGILLTFGKDYRGRLGHEARSGSRTVREPKIVEALLGDEVTVVAAGKR